MLIKTAVIGLSRSSAPLARHMSAITGVRGREIIDSRGNPTVEVDITTKVSTVHERNRSS